MGPKMQYLGNFALELQKTIVIFDISTLEFVKNEYLTHAMNFGVGSAFFKGLMSAFSESLALAPCPLCRGCGINNYCNKLPISTSRYSFSSSKLKFLAALLLERRSYDPNWYHL